MTTFVVYLTSSNRFFFLLRGRVKKFFHAYSFINVCFFGCFSPLIQTSNAWPISFLTVLIWVSIKCPVVYWLANDLSSACMTLYWSLLILHPHPIAKMCSVSVTLFFIFINPICFSFNGLLWAMLNSVCRQPLALGVLIVALFSPVYCQQTQAIQFSPQTVDCLWTQK